MTTNANFFQPGVVRDPTYANVRDEEHLSCEKEFVESLWSTYRPLADPHFRSDARNHFLQRFWEMYLACTLLKRGFTLIRSGNEGPEFYFEFNSQRIWVEAIAPGAGDGPDHVPEIQLGECYDVPERQILLRFTAAIFAKQEKLESARAKGIVGLNEQMILAINSRGIPDAHYRADMPYVVKALLPVGNLTVGIDPKTRAVTDSFHTYREEIRKGNSSHVATTAFLNPRFKSIVAVIHSGVDVTIHPTQLGDEFVVLHNPSAMPSLPDAVFSWSRRAMLESCV